MIGKPRLFVLTAALIGLSALAATVPAIAAAGTITAAGASRPETGATADHARAIPDQKTVPASNQGAVPASFQGWSGEVVTACPTCHIRYVNANFKVPSVNCSQSYIGTSGYAHAFIWAGLDGWGTPTVEQVGISMSCTSKTGSPSYSAFWEMYGLPLTSATEPHTLTNQPVKAGDSISVSVYYDQSNGDYELTFDDKSNGVAAFSSGYQACPTGECENVTAEVIIEVASGGPPTAGMPDFGSVAFSGTTVTSLDGTKGDLCNQPGGLWSNTAVNALASNNDLLADPGSLSTCSGPDGFTDYFFSSN